MAVINKVSVGGTLYDIQDAAAVPAPATAGTAGQVLALDSNLDPVWTNGGGGGGADIDDTAGTGVTNKAWSANKLVSELSAKQNNLPAGGSANQVLALDGNGDLAWITKLSVSATSSATMINPMQIALLRVDAISPGVGGTPTAIYAPNPVVEVVRLA